MAKINRLTNANVYLDGASLLGTAEEVTLPDIKAVTTDFKGLGMIGIQEIFSGIDKMEAKIKWNSFYPETIKKTGNFFKALKLQLRGNLEGYEAGSRTSEKPYVVFMTGTSKNFPTGSFKQQENAEFETNFSITAIRVEVDRVAVVNYDASANIYEVDGVDQLAQYRANLGI